MRHVAAAVYLDGACVLTVPLVCHVVLLCVMLLCGVSSCCVLCLLQATLDIHCPDGGAGGTPGVSFTHGELSPGETP